MSDNRPLLDGYLTRLELAAELRVTARTIDRYERERTAPPSAIIGGRRLYPRGEVQKWIEAKIENRGRDAA